MISYIKNKYSTFCNKLQTQDIEIHINVIEYETFFGWLYGFRQNALG